MFALGLLTNQKTKYTRFRNTKKLLIIIDIIIIIIILARTPEIGQGLGLILSCGARKPEKT